MTDVTLRLYDGRHEILNEENHATVYADARAFILKNL